MTHATEESSIASAVPESETVEIGAPPPLVFAGPLVAGLLLNRFFPISAPSSRLARFSGVLLTFSGSALVWTAAREMSRAGNNPDPRMPVKRVVTGGPYRFTRNPIYMGFALSYAGLSLLARALWPLLLLPAVLAQITARTIQSEEGYLERRFSSTYREYKERVPRWL